MKPCMPNLIQNVYQICVFWWRYRTCQLATLVPFAAWCFIFLWRGAGLAQKFTGAAEFFYPPSLLPSHDGWPYVGINVATFTLLFIFVSRAKREREQRSISVDDSCSPIKKSVERKSFIGGGRETGPNWIFFADYYFFLVGWRVGREGAWWLRLLSPCGTPVVVDWCWRAIKGGGGGEGEELWWRSVLKQMFIGHKNICWRKKSQR